MTVVLYCIDGCQVILRGRDDRRMCSDIDDHPVMMTAVFKVPGLDHSFWFDSQAETHRSKFLHDLLFDLRGRGIPVRLWRVLRILRRRELQRLRSALQPQTD